MALFALLAVGCAALSYGQGDTMAPDELERGVGNAKTTDTIDGSALTLDAHIWRNLMPTPDAHVAAVRIVATLNILGGAHQNDIVVPRLWAVSSSGKPVEASVVRRLMAQGGLRLVATAPLSPDIVVSAWVVAEVRDSTGGRLFIRSPETNIEKVY